MNTINTVANELDEDFKKLRSSALETKEFISKYGHLRPGTYDITKLPYRCCNSYFKTNGGFACGNNPDGTSKSPSSPGPGVIAKLTELCKRHGLGCDGVKLLDFISQSIRLREYIKFVFTKNISLAIELIAEVGESFGFSREEMAQLDLLAIVNYYRNASRDEVVESWGSLIESRSRKKEILSLVTLPPVLFSEKDFFMPSSLSAAPNYITDQVVEGETVLLDQAVGAVDIGSRIVVLEKADPGFDWIFTKPLKALVTKYGGVASHMSIRCAEFGVPAAIGCGEILFSKVLSAGNIVLDCRNKTLRVL